MTSEEKHLRSVAVSPDGKSVAAGGDDSVIRVWEIATGALLRSFDAHRGTGVRALAFSPDGRRLLSGGDDGMAVVWDHRNGRALRSLAGDPRQVYAVAFSPDGKIALTGGWGRAVKAWDPETGRLIRTFAGHHHNEVSGLVVDPANKILATGAWDTSALIWDLQKGTLLGKLRAGDSTVRTVAFSPDGKELVTASGPVEIWDVGNLQPAWRHDVPSRVWSAMFSPDGKTIAAVGCTTKDIMTCPQGLIRLISRSSRDVVMDVATDPGAINSAAFTPDGANIVSGDDQGVVAVWDVSGVLRR